MMENILFEDNHLIALNKKSGEIVQGDKTGDTPLCDSIKEYLKAKLQKPGAAFIGVVHRIDRPVPGARDGRTAPTAFFVRSERP